MDFPCLFCKGVTSDASKVEWGASFGKDSTRVLWNKESEIKINILELSNRVRTPNNLQGQTRSFPSILGQHQCKVGGTKSLDFFLAAKSLWEFCLENNNPNSGLPARGLNKVSDWESSKQNNSS